MEIDGEVVSRPPYASTYWGPAQMLAHLTSNGASLRTGDLFGSGTISGPGADEVGSLLEPSTAASAFLDDGDTVVLRYSAPSTSGGRLTLGEVVGTIDPGRPVDLRLGRSTKGRTTRVARYPARHGLLTPLAIRIGAISWMPKLLPQIVWVDTRLQKATRGKVTVLDIAGLPNLALTVAGRKSGIPRTTPLLCVPHEGGWLIAGSYFGGPNVPLWVGNLRAATTRRRGSTARTTTSPGARSKATSARRCGRSCSAPGPTSRSTRSAPPG